MYDTCTNTSAFLGVATWRARVRRVRQARKGTFRNFGGAHAARIHGLKNFQGLPGIGSGLGF